MNGKNNLRIQGLTMLALLAFGAQADAPRLSSNFYGTVKVDGNAVPAGVTVTALVGVTAYELTESFDAVEGSVYRLNVPGDIADTTGVEGAVDGETVVFRIGQIEAFGAAVWQAGAHTRIDLMSPPAADLEVLIDASTLSWPAVDLATGESSSSDAWGQLERLRRPMIEHRNMRICEYNGKSLFPRDIVRESPRFARNLTKMHLIFSESQAIIGRSCRLYCGLVLRLSAFTTQF